MIQIFSVTAPIFVLIALGFVIARKGLLPRESVAPLGRFILYLAIPALIIRALTSQDLFASIEPMFLVAYGGGAVLTFLTGFVVSRYVLGNPLPLSGLVSLGVSLPNTVFVGYPLLLQVFGEASSVAFAMAITLENLVLMPLAFFLLEVGVGSADGEGRRALSAAKSIAMRLISNPMILAIFIGGCISVSGVPLPGFLARSIDLLAMAGPATALIYIGASLAGTSPRGNLGEVAVVTTGKLVLHPALTVLVVLLLPPFDARLQAAAILLASAPMLTIFPIIGARYGYGTLTARILMISTALAFVSISLILWLGDGWLHTVGS